MPRGRGKSKGRRGAGVPGDHRGASAEQVAACLARERLPKDLGTLYRWGRRPPLMTQPPDRLGAALQVADRVTRSTLQQGKLEEAEQEALDRLAPLYLFGPDDGLYYRTPDGYKPTGLGALNFSCIAKTRAHWRRAFGCQLPILEDLEGAGATP